ncbi:alpha/beta fold hydrolase [Streptomyces candidus]|uniref:Haloalkane dehalogenase n=1 Tax=Streptomyces candidus TaxID=67283 RepID=A0A7X0LU35_9ACTN|nr:alpha/beta fold hydrolase [Streptomyces candidus]MBB6440039.1 haloalkane dehalogenase [Streptomyces candidus]
MTPEELSAAGYPFSPHWYTHRSGARQHYLDEGAGEPVILLHGNPTWSYCWRHLIHGLRGTYRCIAPDHIGMGLSGRPDERRHPYSAMQRLTDLQILTDHLIQERGVADQGWTLVAHDWGGTIGMALARRNPGLVRRLVLLNTVAFPWPHDYRLPLPLRLIRNHQWAARMVHRSNAFVKAAARRGVTQPLPAEVRRAYSAPYRKARHRLAVVRFVQDIPVHPSDPSWPLVEGAEKEVAALAELPAFIGWGDKDPVFTETLLREWQRRLPKAQVHRYPQAGHFVMEDAGRALIPAIQDFLAATPPAGQTDAPRHVPTTGNRERPETLLRAPHRSGGEPQ